MLCSRLFFILHLLFFQIYEDFNIILLLIFYFEKSHFILRLMYLYTYYFVNYFFDLIDYNNYQDYFKLNFVKIFDEWHEANNLKHFIKFGYFIHFRDPLNSLHLHFPL
jgi:hypothetical protein